MALTIEKLFNFDEKLQAQELLNQRADATASAGAPAGYQPILAGMNKIGRNTLGRGGIFGSEDPLLKDKANVDKALFSINKTLSKEEMGDPNKVYPALMDAMRQSGVSAKYILGLQNVMADQQYKKATTDAAMLTAENAKGLKVADYARKQAEKDMDQNRDHYRILNDNYNDVESTQYGDSDRFAKSIGSDDSDLIRNVYQKLHREISLMTSKDEYGNTIPLFTPGQAQKMTESILSMKKKDKDGRETKEYKYIDKGFLGNLIPFKQTEVNLPSNMLNEIKTLIQQEMGVEVNTKDSGMPPGLEGLDKKDQEAYNYAIDALNKDPEDKAARQILNFLNSKKNS